MKRTLRTSAMALGAAALAVASLAIANPAMASISSCPASNVCGWTNTGYSGNTFGTVSTWAVLPPIAFATLSSVYNNSSNNPVHFYTGDHYRGAYLTVYAGQAYSSLGGNDNAFRSLTQY